MLFGLSVDESVPADRDVGIVNDAIDTMDLSCLEAGYSSMGCRPYSPRVLERESELIERIFEEAEQIDAREDEMYGSSSGLRPAYNAQITVDGANQVVVGCDVTCDANDSAQLADQLEQVVQNTGMRPDVVLADSGYSSEETFKALESMAQQGLIPPKEQPREKRRKDLFASKCFARDEDRDVQCVPTHSPQQPLIANHEPEFCNSLSSTAVQMSDCTVGSSPGRGVL